MFTESVGFAFLFVLYSLLVSVYFEKQYNQHSNFYARFIKVTWRKKNTNDYFESSRERTEKEGGNFKGKRQREMYM